jgi:DNA-binding phage protein
MTQQTQESFTQCFFASHGDLCEASATTSLDDAQAGKENAASIAAKAQQKDDEAQTRLAKLNTGAAILAERVESLRDQDTREFEALAERALIEDVDLESEARTSAHRRDLLTQARNIAEHAHAVILPRERLSALLARAVSLTARANLSSWCALEAGVSRYEASKPLLEKDGSVSFGESGAAWTAFQAQMHAHRVASEAVAVVEAEHNRQRMLEAQGVL